MAHGAVMTALCAGLTLTEVAVHLFKIGMFGSRDVLRVVLQHGFELARIKEHTAAGTTAFDEKRGVTNAKIDRLHAFVTLRTGTIV